MENNPSAVSQTAFDAAYSAMRIWIFVALISSLISLFGNAAFEVRIFQVLVGLYRMLTYIIYDALEWPNRFNWPLPNLIRDLTTIFFVAMVVTVFNYRAAVRAWVFHAEWVRAQVTAKQPEAPAPQVTSDISPIQTGATQGAGLGLLVGGPFGVVAGALIGGLVGYLGSKFSEPQEATPEPASVISEEDVQNYLELISVHLTREVMKRALLCVGIGVLLLVGDALAPYLIEVCTRVDEELQTKLEALAEALSISNAS